MINHPEMSHRGRIKTAGVNSNSDAGSFRRFFGGHVPRLDAMGCWQKRIIGTLAKAYCVTFTTPGSGAWPPGAPAFVAATFGWLSHAKTF